MIKCIIVEDEVLAQQVIQSHLQKAERFELVGVCNNAMEAQALLNKYEVDLMFLDIQLPGMTGLNFLRSLNNPPLVVLTTAYAEYALESYEFNVIDYLLKPISFDRFSKTISKIVDGKFVLQNKTESGDVTGDHIFIKSNSKFFKIDFPDIIYIEGMKDYLKIHTQENILVTHQTMQEMEQLLPSKQFIRVHKSYIIAVAHIKSIYGNSIEMGKATIPIGISYKEKVMNLIAR
ncbi:response regulator transcription factor [Panacibacter ginsenosidivorans]|uniref:Response regulator transcription factor n=1 Tax=Panacibacter ginsenosidivorans TaxID=1813871 RepID=A0A5B8VFC5_9BACT|nr:LytTR family DNA-binding domain-containing protein [Panacibacter ginsenosidivorans]QEC69805.1 response regulator transcription factor [Panacibacter ginsenosidivorans]